MSLAKKGLSIFGKLALVVLLLATFSAGLGGVLYLSLRSPEVKVPEIVGKDYMDGERDLASLDLKIRKRTDRFSAEKPNTILEQIPLPGDTVKAGQTISVVISRAQAEGDEKPAEVKKSDDKDKPKDVDEPTEVDKARAKRKAANANANKTASKNNNGNSNGNSNNNSNVNLNGNNNSNAANSGNSNGNSNAVRGGNSNSRTNTDNSGGNSNNKPATNNSNSANRGATIPPVGNRNGNNNRRPQ